MNDAVRQAVFARCAGYCEKCGKPLPYSWALHHRKLRSQGGTDTPDNLVALHHECHNLRTQSVHMNPSLSIKQGYIVPSWADPASWELELPNGSVVCLDKEGNYVEVRKVTDGW